jgi:PelA/Pel-15E family pectate lyase
MNLKLIGQLFLRIAAVFIAIAVSASASTIGANPPVESLTAARIAKLPQAERKAWLAYLKRSEHQRQADKDFLHAETIHAGIKTPLEPPHSNSARSIPLNRDPSWYAGAEARRIADIIVSFQTPAGGWSKNLDMSKEPRRPGEKFAPDNLSKFLSPGDFDASLDPDWNYVGTIDNDATTTELNFLAKVISAPTVGQGTAYRAAFTRGIRYLFAAQFPNGGWPQVWPLEGGYHDAITYNDGAMIEVMELMRRVADGQNEFSFVPSKLRARAAASFTRGMQCTLATQIVANGRLTVWPQQDDALTLQPASGRNFEPPAQCAGESADLLLFMMNDLPHPTIAEQRSIRAAIAWFHKTAIYGQSWERTEEGRQLVSVPGAGPIWARYYQVGTDTPLFADRDKSLHDNVAELSKERRNGYSWFSSDSQRALDRFEKWNAEYPETK